MSQQRRLRLAPRPPRSRRTPAYQLRRRNQTVASEFAPATDDGTLRDDREPVARDDVAEPTSQPVRPDETAPSEEATAVEHPTPTPEAPTPDTTAETPIDATTDLPIGMAAGDDASPEDAGSVNDTLDHDVVRADGGEDEPHDDGDYATYIQSVESAAARSRQGIRTHAIVPAAPAAPADLPGTTVPAPDETDGKGSGAAVVPEKRRGGPPNRRGSRGRAVAAREPDPRPLIKRPKTWFIVAGAILAAALIAAVIWTVYLIWVTYGAYNQAYLEPSTRVVYEVNEQGTPVVVPTAQAQAELPNWDEKDPFNVLLLGIDFRDGEEQPPRSDTIIVVRVNPVTKQVVMMSLPRDLYVTIPGFGMERVNAAYPLGEANRETVPGGGPDLVQQTIEYNFDIRINYFVTIDFTGFRTVVDTIGGVVVDVPAPVKDDQYPTETLGLTREYFPTGLQKMDGETALRYARTRHGDNDIARGDRQQQMLVAIRQQAMSLGLIADAPDLIREFGDSVRTNLNFNQLLALASLGRDVDPAGIIRLNLWDNNALVEHTPAFEGDGFYLEGDWPAIHALVERYYQTSGEALIPTPDLAAAVPSASPDTIEPNAGPAADGGTVEPTPDLETPVTVRNASSYDLAGSAALDILYSAGFDAISREDGDEIVESTVVYDYTGNAETARYIVEQLGLDESNIAYGSGGTGIVVVVGDDIGAVLSE